MDATELAALEIQEMDKELRDLLARASDRNLSYYQVRVLLHKALTLAADALDMAEAEAKDCDEALDLLNRCQLELTPSPSTYLN